MKFRLFLILSSLWVPQFAFAALDGLHVVYNLETSAHTDAKNVADATANSMKARVEYYIVDGAVRFENQTDSSPLGNMVLIRTTVPPKSFILFPKDKAYMEIPEMQIESAEREVQMSEPFKPTGKKKEIVGYGCEVMARELPDRREEACTSSKLSKEYKHLQAAMPKSRDGKMTIPKGMDGFPLEYRTISKQDKSAIPEMTMMASEIHKAPLSASLFEVPSDYQSKPFPAMDPAAIKAMKKPGAKGEQQVPENLQEKLEEMQKMMEEMKKKGMPPK